MGYDVSYHPISPEEMNRWYFEPIKDDAALERLAVTEQVDIEILRQVFNHYRQYLSDTPHTDIFEMKHGYLLAAAQGLFRPYFYNRNCLLTSLLWNHWSTFQKYFISLREFVPAEYRSLKFSNTVVENWCGGAYLSASGVVQLEYDICHNADVASKLLQEFAPDGLRVLLKSLRYAKENGLGLLEATEVISPPLGNGATNIDNAEGDFFDNNEESIKADETEIQEIFNSLGLAYLLRRYNSKPLYYTAPSQLPIQDKVQNKSEKLHPLLRLKKKLVFWQRFLGIIWFFLFVCPMSIIMLWGAWTYFSEISYKKQLSAKGIQGEAEITKCYKEEYSKVTYYYIDYVLIVKGKEYPRKYVWVDKAFWHSVDVGSPLPVTYLPDAPRINRSIHDKIIEWSFEFFILGSIGTVFFGTFFLIYCVLGFDMHVFSEPRRQGKYYLFRHGKLIKVFKLPFAKKLK
ncbi:MAG: DUF3592 domain-containing protein [Planctomycetaceae bacterium]|jgi:hypothetical protein|nr:DUF3592 domain-containing protein [Planctomycetaceae bacterium]